MRGVWVVRAQLAAIPGLVVASALFLGIYLSFLVLSISIADADTPLDGRILLILIPPGTMVAGFLGAVTLRESSRRVRWLVTAGICGLLLLHGFSTAQFITDRKGVLWGAGANSPTLDALCSLPQEAIIFSNDPYAIYMAVRRKTETLPFVPPVGTPSAGAREDFRREMNAMQEALASKGGWVVYWNALGFLDPVIDAELLKKTVPVVESKSVADGTLWRVAPRAVTP